MARHSHPIGFDGRRDAISAPNKGNARLGATRARMLPKHDLVNSEADGEHQRCEDQVFHVVTV